MLALVPLEDDVPVLGAAVWPPVDGKLVLPPDNGGVSFDEDTVELAAAELTLRRARTRGRGRLRGRILRRENAAGVLVVTAALWVSARPSAPSSADRFLVESDMGDTAPLVELVETWFAAIVSGDAMVRFSDAESVVVAVGADAGVTVGASSEVA